MVHVYILMWCKHSRERQKKTQGCVKMAEEQRGCICCQCLLFKTSLSSTMLSGRPLRASDLQTWTTPKKLFAINCSCSMHGAMHANMRLKNVAFNYWLSICQSVCNPQYNLWSEKLWRKKLSGSDHTLINRNIFLEFKIPHLFCLLTVRKVRNEMAFFKN